MVERVQRTAREEFWSTLDPKGPDAANQLEAWRTFYSQHRSHGAPGGKTPAERIAELTAAIPSAEATRAAYHPDKERRRRQNTRYRWLPTSARVT